MKFLKNLLIILSFFIILVTFASCEDKKTDNIGNDKDNQQETPSDTDPGSGSSTDPGSGSSTDPGSGSATDPGSGSATDPGSGSSTDPGSETPAKRLYALDQPTISLVGDVISWSPITNAVGYIVVQNDTEIATIEQDKASYKISVVELGTYVFSVKAVGDLITYKNSPISNEVTYEKVVTTQTLYVVGDSTSCSFEADTSDQKKYYPRVGYGTQLNNYLSDKLKIENLAVSGRSSISYVTDETSGPKYEIMKNNIKAGDYLLIAFGHNDQKDDSTRYSNPNQDSETVGSFKYNLKHYYIDVAKEAGAIPILCTPIVRRNGTADTMTDTLCHIWGGSVAPYIGGDYPKAIRDLATETNVSLIDNTAMTKELYETLGYEETLYLHAWTNTKPTSVDNTHLNIYGAKKIAYMVCNAMKNLDNSIKNYVLTNLTEPTKTNDLLVNENYVERVYTAPTKGLYIKDSESGEETSVYDTISPWMASAFGYLGGAPTASNYVLTETTSSVTMQVLNNKGKIASTSDGIFMYYQQVAINSDFTIKATANVSQINANTQVGFGLTVRDDMYADQSICNDSSIASSNICCGGPLAAKDGSSILSTSRRDETQLIKGIATPFAINTDIDLEISKVGNTYTLKYGSLDPVVYSDVDLGEVDSNFVYVGLYCARNITVTFSNISLIMAD